MLLGNGWVLDNNIDNLLLKISIKLYPINKNKNRVRLLLLSQSNYELFIRDNILVSLLIYISAKITQFKKVFKQQY